MLTGLRAVFLILVIAGTTAFVVGVGLERADGDADHPSPAAVSETAEHEGSEAVEAHGVSDERPEAEDELRPLGVDVESWPLVVAAAALSLALGATVFTRPRVVPLLIGAALFFLMFAGFDAREVVHQAEEDEGGLAFLAGAVTTLHLAAAAAAATMAMRADRRRGAAGTMVA